MAQTKEERKRSISKHSQQWQKRNLKKVIVCFNVGTNEKDRETYEFLKKQGSPAGFLKWLARDECEALREAEKSLGDVENEKGDAISWEDFTKELDSKKKNAEKAG